MVRDEERAIWDAVERANRGWLRGDMDAVSELFDPDVRLVAPGLSPILDGREAVIGTYEEFAAAATVDRFEIKERSLLVRGDVAVATYCFDIAYRMDGEGHAEQGREVLVFARSASEWRAVWRTQVPTSGCR